MPASAEAGRAAGERNAPPRGEALPFLTARPPGSASLQVKNGLDRYVLLENQAFSVGLGRGVCSDRKLGRELKFSLRLPLGGRLVRSVKTWVAVRPR